ncbi:hypothetical protein BJ970_007537 [Saccharopolyspora phatthalungensis]|uniref:Uncharacterized protein n=1 Tax=Saccharopolyspora phatthalungensis TaxID=664693 RepID=A0A840QI78_9PSEU|nr:hypothetical protein [Saccharopolyspora phatthalungensis]
MLRQRGRGVVRRYKSRIGTTLWAFRTDARRDVVSYLGSYHHDRLHCTLVHRTPHETREVAPDFPAGLRPGAAQRWARGSSGPSVRPLSSLDFRYVEGGAVGLGAVGRARQIVDCMHPVIPSTRRNAATVASQARGRIDMRSNSVEPSVTVCIVSDRAARAFFDEAGEAGDAYVSFRL